MAAALHPSAAIRASTTHHVRCSSFTAACWPSRRRATLQLAAAQRQEANSTVSRCTRVSWGSNDRCRQRRRLVLAAAAPTAESPQRDEDESDENEEEEEEEEEEGEEGEEEEEEEEEEGGALVASREGYRFFELEGADFLVSELPDGRLDLRDVYVAAHPDSGDGDEATRRDSEEEEYEQLQVEGLGPQPQAYHFVPWYTEYSGDHIAEIPAKEWVWRMYLVPVVSLEPFHLSFENIWVLDGKTASLKPVEVHRLAPADTPLQDLRLRIRDDVVTVDVLESLPSWEEAVQQRLKGLPALSELEAQRLEEYLDSLKAARDQGIISEEEFEHASDVHWLEGMQAGARGAEPLGSARVSEQQGAQVDVDVAEPTQEEDVIGGWDQEVFADFMPEYEDDEDGGDTEDFDSPASDY